MNYPLKTCFGFLFAAFLLLPATRSWAQQGTVIYQMTLSGGGRNLTTGSTMRFQNGNVRTEMSIPLPGAPTPLKQTVLMLANKPNTVYTLNDAGRTYTENTPSAGKENSAKATVKVVGKEKIQNLNCTHVLVSFDKGSTMELWTTKDIPGYEKLLAYWRTNQSFGTGNLFNELKKSGADGFVAKMQNQIGSNNVTMELVKYDAKPVAASLFQIPKDYKKGAPFDPSLFRGLTPGQRQKSTE